MLGICGFIPNGGSIPLPCRKMGREVGKWDQYPCILQLIDFQTKPILPFSSDHHHRHAFLIRFVLFLWYPVCLLSSLLPDWWVHKASGRPGKWGRYEWGTERDRMVIKFYESRMLCKVLSQQIGPLWIDRITVRGWTFAGKYLFGQIFTTKTDI